MDKRTKILKAAVQVFAKKGFYNAKVAEIAKRANVAAGTIYLYFKNKDEILISIFEEEMENIIAEINQSVITEKNSLKKLETFIHKHLEFVRKKPALAQVFQVELRQSNKFIKEYTGSKLKEYLDMLGRIVEEGQKAGTMRDDLHPGLVKRAVFGALDEIATHWVLAKNGKVDLEESAHQVSGLFKHALIKNQ